MQRLATTAMAIALAGVGCGRYGFAPLSGDDGDAGGPTEDATGPGIDGDPGADGAVVPVDAGLPAGCMIVTIDGDEDDAGESREPPHLGAGLSLREAIGLANDTAGFDCIAFSGTRTIQPTSNLPAFSDFDGAVVDGAGATVTIDGSLMAGAGAIGLNLAASDTQVTRVALRNWGAAGTGFAVRVGSATTLGPNVDISMSEICVAVLGSASNVVGNRIHDCLDVGVEIANGVGGALIARNVIYNNFFGGARVAGGAAAVLRHNTFFQNTGAGIEAVNGATLTAVENNAFVGNTDFALDASGVSVLALDHNGYFGNGGECRGCVTGANAVFGDPMFASPPNDVTLQSGSPFIDAGRDTGLDVNGNGPGLFDGDAPDIGAVESE